MPIPAGVSFLAVPGFDALALSNALPATAAAWKYVAESQCWQAHLTGELQSQADLPPSLSPGDAVFVRADTAGQLAIADSASRVRFYHQDHLGSSSVVTDALGNSSTETSFLPFGASRAVSTSPLGPQDYRFSQKECDSESGLNCFDIRYDAGSLGRFTSTDKLSSSLDRNRLANPQTGNPYSYCNNRPQTYIDPTGLDGVIIVGGVSINDPQHDHNPDNFIKAAVYRVQAMRRAGYEEDIVVAIHAASYEKRAQHDGVPKDKYLNILRNEMQKSRFKLVDYRTAKDITKLLSAAKDNTIDTVMYFGHSTDNKLFLDYGFERPGGVNESWGMEEARGVRRGWFDVAPASFRDTAYFASWGCFQGSEGGLAEGLHNLWGIPTSGSIGYSFYDIRPSKWAPSGREGFKGYYKQAD